MQSSYMKTSISIIIFATEADTVFSSVFKLRRMASSVSTVKVIPNLDRELKGN